MKDRSESAEATRARLKRQDQEKIKRMREARAQAEQSPPQRPSPSRREVIEYAAERLECVKATLVFKILGRDGEALHVTEFYRAERGILEFYVNGRADHSNHARSGAERAELFMRDAAEMTARTLNGRGR